VLQQALRRFALFAATLPPGAPSELAGYSANERARLATELPTAHVIVLQASHYLFITARDEVLRVVRPFIRGVSARSVP